MGFRFKCWGLGLVLSWASIAVADDANLTARRITVLVNDSARVSATVLTQAEMEATRIFDAAGIEVAWVNCQDKTTHADGACRKVPGTNQFVLHIVPTGKVTNDLVFGVAFLAEDGSGKYCNVFLDRIRDAHRDLGTSTSQLLGTVAAHELGHLLLGSHAHSRMGIMEPVWNEEAFRQTGMGTFLFTTEQAELMRARIGSEGMVLRAGREEAVARGQ
jgi:hypothetical protein